MKSFIKKYSLFLSVLFLIITGIIFTFFYAKSSPGSKIDIKYSFFVAGHTYGSPSGNKIGLHPPFKDNFSTIIINPHIEMGFLTGDIVWTSTTANWDAVDSDLNLLSIPVYFVPGNHDVTDRKLFTNRYGKSGKTYWHFKHRGDLFIVLDPNLANWNISGSQLAFLKNILSKDNSYRNVFVFFHQLLWWDQNNKFRNIKINSTQGRAGEINFWEVIEPMFHNLSNEVFMFAGDIGAFRDHLPMYYQYDNMHFIGSGMGGGINDNFIIVNVPVNVKEKIAINLIWLNFRLRGNQSIEDFHY